MDVGSSWTLKGIYGCGIFIDLNPIPGGGGGGGAR